MVFKTAGMEAPWAGHLNRILQNRFGVRLVWGVGCTGSEDEFDYVRGYNEIASQIIFERFGIDVLKEAIAEAEEAEENEPDDESSELEEEVNEPEMESPVDGDGMVACAYCGDRFNVHERGSWDGQTHKACGRRLRLYEVGEEDAL